MNNEETKVVMINAIMSMSNEVRLGANRLRLENLTVEELSKEYDYYYNEYIFMCNERSDACSY